MQMASPGGKASHQASRVSRALWSSMPQEAPDVPEPESPRKESDASSRMALATPIAAAV